MVDPVEAFERQFDPVEDGYLYYPSPKSGGKLVSHEEYEELLLDWTNTSKGKRFWLMLGAIIGAIFIFVVIEQTVSLPEWGFAVFLATIVSAIMGWLFWAAFAPRRLVKGRPDFGPPRSKELNLQLAHDTLSWKLVSLVLIVSGTIFANMVVSGPQSLVDWLWVGGSAAFFVMYLIAGYRKWRGWR